MDIFKVIELLYKRFIDCYDFIFIIIGILLYFRKKKIKIKITNNYNHIRAMPLFIMLVVFTSDHDVLIMKT